MKKCTFILTAYNHSKYIKEALDSIEYQANYIYQLIITNDASIDNTSEIIQEFIINSRIKNIKYINNKENKGLNACLNEAFSIISGDIVVLQSGDDLSSSERVKDTLEEFSKTDKLFLISSYQIIGEDGAKISNKIRGGDFTDLRKLIKRGAALPIYGFSFRKELLDFMPKLDESISNEDDMIGFYAVLYGGIVICSKVLYYYRIHQTSMSNWAISSNGSFLLKNFYHQLKNREQNYNNWKLELIRSGRGGKENIRLIDKKLCVLSFFREINNVNIINRLFFSFQVLDVITLRDLIVLVGGEHGIKMIPKIKKFLLFK